MCRKLCDSNFLPPHVKAEKRLAAVSQLHKQEVEKEQSKQMSLKKNNKKKQQQKKTTKVNKVALMIVQNKTSHRNASGT